MALEEEVVQDVDVSMRDEDGEELDTEKIKVVSTKIMEFS